MSDGGAAFPVLDGGQIWDGRDGGHVMNLEFSAGMSLRDFFAAHAMQGLLASCAEPAEMTYLAVTAYKQADAMLAAREREK